MFGPHSLAQVSVRRTDAILGEMWGHRNVGTKCGDRRDVHLPCRAKWLRKWGTFRLSPGFSNRVHSLYDPNVRDEDEFTLKLRYLHRNRRGPRQARF